jgi:hypothetical protein
LRISPEEVKQRMDAGEPMTVLDVRNNRAWEASPDRVRGAIHLDMGSLSVDPAWPRDGLTVVY